MAPDHRRRNGVPLYFWTAAIAAVAGFFTFGGVVSDMDAMPPFYVHCTCLVLTFGLSVRHILQQRRDPDGVSVGAAVSMAILSALVAGLWIAFFVFATWFTAKVEGR